MPSEELGFSKGFWRSLFIGEGRELWSAKQINPPTNIIRHDSPSTTTLYRETRGLEAVAGCRT